MGSVRNEEIIQNNSLNREKNNLFRKGIFKNELFSGIIRVLAHLAVGGVGAVSKIGKIVSPHQALEAGCVRVRFHWNTVRSFEIDGEY